MFEWFDWQLLQHFHFLRPLWLLGLLPMALLLYIQFQQHDLLSQWRGAIAEHLLPAMIVQREPGRRAGPAVAMGLVALLLFVALAGPSWQQRPSPFSEDNAALLIALDLSESMEQADVQPSRLLRAKQKISDLLALRGDSHTGLIAYAGTAHTVIPLSNDRLVISHFLDAMSTGMMPRPGKQPQAVLPVMADLLKEVEVPVTLLLVGDGGSEAAVTAYKDFFDNSPHQLLVWGIGKSQQQLQGDGDGAYESAITPLQESMLQQIADAGHYQAMTLDKSDVDNIYRRVDNYFLLAEDDNRPWVDAGYWLVFPLMLLMLLWFRRGWVLQW